MYDKFYFTFKISLFYLFIRSQMTTNLMTLFMKATNSFLVSSVCSVQIFKAPQEEIIFLRGGIKTQLTAGRLVLFSTLTMFEAFHHNIWFHSQPLVSKMHYEIKP